MNKKGRVKTVSGGDVELRTKEERKVRKNVAKKNNVGFKRSVLETEVG